MPGLQSDGQARCGTVKKVVFVYHSVGGHWLAHEYGGLVSALNRRGFFVNDITYVWQPPQCANGVLKRARNRALSLLRRRPAGARRIGDRTDIGHCYEWFRGPDAQLIMEAVYRENHESAVFGDHANARSIHPVANPGADQENDIVIIKPCYPNSSYRGRGDEAATAGEWPPRGFAAESPLHTVGNCKRIYHDVLLYFQERRDKYFVIVTAPPRLALANDGETARRFSNWLVHEWLQEHGYAGRNVMVFDLYNVLTSGPGGDTNDLGEEHGNHHRLWRGREQHVVQDTCNLLAYGRAPNDNHPSRAGLQKATAELVELFAYRYEAWRRRNP